MTENIKATIESQLGNAPCPINDNENIFWLRELDDYQSKFALGNSLAAQYRFKDAIAAYENAMRIRQDDWKLLYSLGGAYLTIRQFDKAMKTYHRCIALGAGEAVVAYPLGIGCYLQRDYVSAAAWFKKCLPCEDEMAIAVIYWHTISCFRADREAALLDSYHKNMKVGHHTAYKLAVSVFCGEISREQALEQIHNETGDLNYVISLYGLCVYLEHIGEHTTSKRYVTELLKHSSIWPCISYLAAWNDVNSEAV